MGAWTIIKVVSGAQTGADRAALYWAIFRDVPHGGWYPKGRKAEGGKIPPQYQLTETPSASYLQRADWNVRDPDGTVTVTGPATPLAANQDSASQVVVATIQNIGNVRFRKLANDEALQR